MPREKKGKVSSRRSTATSSGHGQSSEEQVLYGHYDGDDTPRSHQEVDAVPGSSHASMGQESPLSTQEFEPNYTASNAGTYGEQGYPPQQQYPQWDDQQQDEYNEQQEDWNALPAPPPASSHSGSSRRDHGRHGQRHSHHHGWGSVREPPAPLAEETMGELAEQQMAGGTTSLDGTYNTGGVSAPSYPLSYQGRNAFDAFGGYGAQDQFGSPMAFLGNVTVPPALGNPGPFHGMTAGTSHDATNRGYDLHHSKQFRVGRVLRVNWPELQGQTRNVPSNTYTDLQSVRKNDVFSKNRRFVILRSYSGHSLCAPILTYGNNACKKNGVHPEYHGIIYTSPQPQMLPGEPALGFAPVAMVPYDATESLRKESRVNYSKYYTVEHNIYVSFVGEVLPQDMDIIRSASI